MFSLFSLVTLLAQDPIGVIEAPNNMPAAIDPATGQLTGIMVLLNTLLRLVFIAAGLWAFFNIIRAGFTFMNAGGDPKKVAEAWEIIWKSGVGLIIIVSSFLVAAVVGLILFGDATAILNPKLPTQP